MSVLADIVSKYGHFTVSLVNHRRRRTTDDLDGSGSEF